MTAWTPDMMARFAQMWTAGATPSEIARALGVTVNAVAGKRSRMGLEPRPHAIKPKSGPEQPKRLEQPSAGFAEPSRAVSRAGCQWIDGEPLPDDSCKCDKPVKLGKPYCEFHMKKAYINRRNYRAAEPKAWIGPFTR